GRIRQGAAGLAGARVAAPHRAVPHSPRRGVGEVQRRRGRGQGQGIARRRCGRAGRARHGGRPRRGEGRPAAGAREGHRLAGGHRLPAVCGRRRFRRQRAPADHRGGGDRWRAGPYQGRARETRIAGIAGRRREMINKPVRHEGHLLSPDGNWFWDGTDQQWKPTSVPTPEEPSPAASHAYVAVMPEPSKALSSFVGSVRSEDLVFGQTALVWARWILIGTGLVLSFWTPADLLTLQVQLAAIIVLAFGNFYLHVQLLRGRPAIDTIVYLASVGDLCVVTALVIVQGGYASPVFVFYFAAVVGISVAFPTILTAGYTAIVIGVYGIICVATAPSDDL